MIQETSLLAYEEIKNKMGERQAQIFDALKVLGIATDYEIARFLGKMDPNYVRPRRYELVNRLKLVGFAGKRSCKITGRMALTWKCVK